MVVLKAAMLAGWTAEQLVECLVGMWVVSKVVLWAVPLAGQKADGRAEKLAGKRVVMSAESKAGMKAET